MVDGGRAMCIRVGGGVERKGKKSDVMMATPIMWQRGAANCRFGDHEAARCERQRTG